MRCALEFGVDACSIFAHSGPDDEHDTRTNTPLAISPADPADDETYTDPVDDGFEGGDDDDE